MIINPPVTHPALPNTDFYIRQDKDHPTVLAGPVSEMIAWAQAIKLSQDPQYLCTCQVYTFVGDREGDYGPSHMQVVAVYVNGKMILGGWKADRFAKLGVAYDTSRRVGK